MTRRALLFIRLIVSCAFFPLVATAQSLNIGEGVITRPVPDKAESDTAGALDLPYSQILRDPSPPYDHLFRPVGLGSRLQPKIGGATLGLRTDLFRGGLSENLPLQPGVRPTKAEIKIGRLYFDVTSLSGSLLYSDNVNQTEDNRRDGLIGIVTLNGIGVFQVTDNLRLAFKAGLIWLPFRGEFGVAGFARDSVSGRLYFNSEPYLLSQLSYDLHLAHWDITFTDHFKAAQALFSGGTGSYFDIFAGQTFDEEDRAGRYVFRSRTSGGNTGTQVRVNDPGGRFSQTFVRLDNTVGVNASRLLPTVTRLDIGAYHSDIWYYGASDELLAHSREVAYISLNSERETLRFKPFASYRVSRYDSNDWDQEARAGIHGPITENLQFRGSVGYFLSGPTDKERFLADALLQHTIGPQTYQQFEYRRDITSPEQDLEETYTYRLRQVLGPYLYADLFGSRSTFEDLNENGSGTEEWRAGVRFTSNMSPKTSLRVSGLYSHIDHDNNAFGTLRIWTAFAQLRHRYTKSLEATLTYQYQNRDSTRPGDSFFENLGVLTLTKYF